jgi:hypothetical protein
MMGMIELDGTISSGVIMSILQCNGLVVGRASVSWDHDGSCPMCNDFRFFMVAFLFKG